MIFNVDDVPYDISQWLFRTMFYRSHSFVYYVKNKASLITATHIYIAQTPMT